MKKIDFCLPSRSVIHIPPSVFVFFCFSSLFHKWKSLCYNNLLGQFIYESGKKANTFIPDKIRRQCKEGCQNIVIKIDSYSPLPQSTIYKIFYTLFCGNQDDPMRCDLIRLADDGREI